MPSRSLPPISPRKQPRQTRSTELVAAVLQAATRVLEREGAAAFTTSRVAHAAGVSVGSLYQYFPNKQSILFRLQQDEWQATTRLLHGILEDPRRPPALRLRRALAAFFQTEWEEAPLRRALAAAAPLTQHAHGEEKSAATRKLLRQVIRAAAPHLSSARVRSAAELYIALGAVGEWVSEQSRTRAQVARWAATVGDMFIGYITPPALPSRRRGPPGGKRGSAPDRGAAGGAGW